MLNGRAELFRELRHKTARALLGGQGSLCVRNLLGESITCGRDSRPAYRGIRALRSSKHVSQCTTVRAEGGDLLTEESDLKAR